MMTNNSDPLAALAAVEAAVERRGETGHYDLPAERVGRKTVREVTATDAVRAGKFDRKTVYITPSMIEWVAGTAAAEGVGVLAFYRFLLAAGKEAYESGRARPEAVAPLVHRLKTDEEN